METWLIVLISVASFIVFLMVAYFMARYITWRSTNQPVSVPTVAIDPHEYKGLWYEIARYPQWFEQGCRHATANYEPTEEGLKVVNACRVNGTYRESTGTAIPTDYPGIYGVSFFPGIYGQYVVTYRDHDTSIVTNGDKSSLWILSRHPRIQSEKRRKLTTWLVDNGFDTRRLEFDS